jgi:hypothetical protein
LLSYYKQNNKSPFSRSILIFDEPERNLHPDAIKQLLKILKREFNPAQIFLTSHSIDVLASLEYNEIFHIKQDTLPDIQHTLVELIEELAGNCYEHTQRLYNSLATWSYYNFIIQCLSNPEVINIVNKNDPQVEAFVNRIKKRLQNKTAKLKILEIGAGSGRVYKSATDCLQHCEFHAYEPNYQYKEELSELGITLYDQFEYISGTFDIILLCNVLHEITPKEWMPKLNKLICLLKTDGEFIFIERNVLTAGEHAHEYDFFVLKSDELSKLFNIDKEKLSNFVVENSRILCVPVEKSLLTDNAVTQDSINKTITALKDRSWDSIKKIKELINSGNDEGKKMKSGYELAFYSTQYINCKIFLEHQ